MNNYEDLVRINLARRELPDFIGYTFANVSMTWFHEAFYKKLDDFAHGRIKNLMIFVPPQHGKSEGSTRRLPAYLLGLNPNLNIAIASYNSLKSRKFNREIQRVIDTPEYEKIFPNTKLSGMGESTTGANYTRTSDECEIINHTGGFKTVGIGGSLTGDPVDILIMDDLYKDAKNAWSPVVREAVSEWYDTTADTRLHNDSQQLIVYTRWHHEDLAGELLRKEPDNWEVLIFPALKVGEPTELDLREPDAALWPEKHSEKELKRKRNRNPHSFESLYQQNPKPKEGLLYKEFKTYSSLPAFDYVKNYTDVADKGKDYLCSVVYIEHNELKYVIDVIYTQKPNEDTEPMQAKQLRDFEVNESRIESNNGGRAYGRNVERLTNDLGNRKTSFDLFHQSDNKESRIKSNSSTVNNTIVMPDNWHIRWPDFYNHITNYMATGTNKHDDAPDVLTGIVENESFGISIAGRT